MPYGIDKKSIQFQLVLIRTAAVATVRNAECVNRQKYTHTHIKIQQQQFGIRFEFLILLFIQSVFFSPLLEIRHFIPFYNRTK